jgi:hypothetical protein
MISLRCNHQGALPEYYDEDERDEGLAEALCHDRNNILGVSRGVKGGMAPAPPALRGYRRRTFFRIRL